MRKTILAALAAFALLLCVPTEADAYSYAKGIIMDGQQIYTDVAPIIENGRTLVPVRGVLEAMGASVTWNQATRTATAFLGESSTSVTIDSSIAYVDGYPVMLDVPPKIINGRTMVPIRFMAEGIGYNVSFNNGYVYLDWPEAEDGDDEFYAVMDEFDTGIMQASVTDEDVKVETSYNDSENAVVVSFEGDGATDEARLATQDEYSGREWDEVVEYMRLLSLGIVEYFGQKGYDVNGIVEIINDEDPDYVLLQINNGVVTYDETGRN